MWGESRGHGGEETRSWLRPASPPRPRPTHRPALPPHRPPPPQVRNPWTRAHSAWKFLRKAHILEPGTVISPSGEPKPGNGLLGEGGCAEGAWGDYCGDPLLLGRLCLVQPHCCR